LAGAFFFFAKLANLALKCCKQNHWYGSTT
jgi:hypothetical protein